MIKISIIVPVYNSDKFLKKCLKSILNQTLKEIEVIVINDGSSDNSLNIIEELMITDNRIILINKQNEGVSIARNTGISLARGKYILNIDSDDMVKKNYCKEMYEYAEEKGVDILISDFFSVKNNKNNYITDFYNPTSKIYSGSQYLEIFLKNNFKGYMCNKLILKELFIKNNLKFNSEVSIMEDALLLSQLIKKSNKIGKLNKAYYFYLVHQSSATNNLSEKYFTNINRVFNLMKMEIGNENLNKIIDKRWCYNLLSYILLTNDNNLDEKIYFLFTKIKNCNLDIKLESFKYEKMLNILKKFPNKKLVLFFKFIYKIKSKKIVVLE